MREILMERVYTIGNGFRKDYAGNASIEFEILETGICEIHMTEEDEFNPGHFENRTLTFNVLGNEMLPFNHLIMKDEVIEIIKELSASMNRSYTLHKEGIPHITVTPSKIITF